MTQFEPGSNVLEERIINKMKADLYYLIRRHCKAYSISGLKTLYLHDSTQIRYFIMDILELERFIRIIQYDYRKYFLFLMSNISYEEISMTSQYHNKVIGSIRIQETNNLRTKLQTNNIVSCSSIVRSFLIPENILLAALLLSINTFARRLLKRGIEGIIAEFKAQHYYSIERIINFSGFLLKDKIMNRLVNHYLKTYDNINQVIIEFLRKAERGQVDKKYFHLMSLIREWKILKWLNTEPELSLRKALTTHLDNIGDARLYEMWIFYKILEIFKPVIQTRKNRSIFKNDRDISLEYHKKFEIGWTLEKRGVFSSLVKRYPDITISKGGLYLVVIDAKCMKYSEIESYYQEPGPDRNIVNQMLIYMNHDKRCKIGVVVFADDADIDGIVMRDEEERQILFLNCYPHSESQEQFFNKLRQLLKINNSS